MPDILVFHVIVTLLMTIRVARFQRKKWYIKPKWIIPINRWFFFPGSVFPVWIEVSTFCHRLQATPLFLKMKSFALNSCVGSGLSWQRKQIGRWATLVFTRPWLKTKTNSKTCETFLFWWWMLCPRHFFRHNWDRMKHMAFQIPIVSSFTYL